MKNNLSLSRIFASVFVNVNLFYSSATFGQTVIINTLDYLPRLTLLFNGSGFVSGEKLTLHVLH